MKTKLKSALGLAAMAALAVLLTGCFSDPNPRDRFAFPGDQLPPVIVAKAGGGGPVAVTPLVPANAGEDLTKLHVGDLITVTFSDVPPPGLLPQTVRIPQDGMLTLPYNIRVKAAGRATTDLQDDIRAAYVPSLYINLTATVKAEDRVYFVGGEVRNPNRQLYLGEMTVTRAIITANGFTDFADRKKIELRRANGQTYTINWDKVRKNPKLDLEVFPNDHITVQRAIW